MKFIFILVNLFLIPWELYSTSIWPYYLCKHPHYSTKSKARMSTSQYVGPQGPPGSQGPQGPMGPTGIGLTGPTGPTGSKGDIGPMGPTGLQGIAGKQGDIGPPGTTGERGLQGPQGPMGPTGVGLQGPKGDIGPMGPTGLQGIAGKQGDIGPPGTTGERGLQGPQGPMGPTGVGLQGPKGDIGPMGPTGLQGIPGKQGDIGPPGTTGERGLQGLQGPPGATGERGPIGPTGPNTDDLDHIHADLVNDSKIKLTYAKDSFIGFNKISIKYGKTIDQFDDTSFIINEPGNYFIQCTLLTYYSSLGEIQLMINDQPIGGSVPLVLSGLPLSIQEIIRINDAPAKLKIKVLKYPISIVMGKAGSINIIRLSQ